MIKGRFKIFPLEHGFLTGVKNNVATRVSEGMSRNSL
jgi:hypothetical protein